MTCRLCNRSDLEMAKSHIIPRALVHDLRADKKHLLVVDTATGDNSHTQSGDWDDDILCRACEASFSPWDSYAVDFFRSEPTNIFGSNSIAQWFEVNNHDYSKLKLFFISLIWRASVTTRPFFSAVSLGPYEAIAANHIQTSNPGSQDDFPVTINKFGQSQAAAGAERVHAAPTRLRKAGHIAYAFIFSGYQCIIWPGKKILPPSYHHFLLTAQHPLIIPNQPFDETGTAAILSRVMALRQRNVT